MPKIRNRVHKAGIIPISIVSILLLTSHKFLIATAQDLHSHDLQALYSHAIAGPFIVEGLRNNPTLKAEDKRYQAAKASIDASGVLPNPRIQLSHFMESVQTRTGPQKNVIMLQQPIPWTGKLSRARSIARSEAESLWYAYAAQQFALIDRIADSAIEIAYLDKAISLTKKNIALLRQLERITEERVKSGGELNDLLRLQVEIERFDDLVARESTAREASSEELRALIGGDRTAGFPVFEWEAPGPIVSDPALWLNALSKDNPQIALLRALEKSHEARERLANLASKPDFTVGINYLDTGDAINPATPGSGQDPWALMVGVSLPVWGKANRSIALNASLEKEALRARIEERTLALTGQARGWIAKLKDSEKRIERYDTRLVPLASQAKEITESSYRANRASLLDVIDSERTLIELERQYWRASADNWIARWKLATLSGGLWLN